MHAALFLRAPGRKRRGKEEEEEAYQQTRGQLHHHVNLAVAQQPGPVDNAVAKSKSDFGTGTCVQCDTSGCGKPPVDIKTTVP